MAILKPEVGTTPTPPIPAVVSPKPGWKTTEFWLHLLAMLLGAAMALIPSDGTPAKVIGATLAILSALGYTAGRVAVKNGHASLLAQVFDVATQELPDLIALLTGSVTPEQARARAQAAGDAAVAKTPPGGAAMVVGAPTVVK